MAVGNVSLQNHRAVCPFGIIFPPFASIFEKVFVLQGTRSSDGNTKNKHFKDH